MTWTRSPANRAILGLAAVYAVMIAIVVGLRLGGFQVGMAVRLAIMVAVAVPAIAFIFQYWRSIDEAAREAQKWAWFWGGSLGMGVGLVATTLGPIGLADSFAGASPAKLMAYGGMTVAMAQLIGFLGAWAYWWSARR